jgi:hypothetical protein
MLFGHNWDAGIRELVCLPGWLNVAALGNLLPVPGYDGSYIWPRTWNPRLRALAHMPGLALLAALTIGGTSVLILNGAVRATFSGLDTWLFMGSASVHGSAWAPNRATVRTRSYWRVGVALSWPHLAGAGRWRGPKDASW